MVFERPRVVALRQQRRTQPRQYTTEVASDQAAKPALPLQIASGSVSGCKHMPGRHPCTCRFRNSPSTVGS
jgi:hypothetical protein